MRSCAEARWPAILGLLLIAITGMAMDDADPVQDADGRWRIVANDRWRPCALHWDVERGSILDCSFLLDAPAGKHGRLRIVDGHFEFAGRPGQRVRLSGNHVGLEGITKPECDLLAERFARLGYNSARIHVYDQDLAGRRGSSTVLDPGQLDVLDWLFHCCKQRGIYLTIDLYVSRVLLPGEIPEYPKELQHGFKLAAHLLESGHRDWTEFARTLLLHRNPYTGLTWMDDPALVTISLLNEDTPYEQVALTPEIWQTVLKEECRRAGTDPDDRIARRRYLTERVGDSYQRKMLWLHGLGAAQPLSGVNYQEFVFQALLRDRLDYVDNHSYYDHPVPVETPGRTAMVDTPLRYRMHANEEDNASMPRTAMPTRIFGKPFTLSEYAIVYPNAYRASTGLMAAGYAGLQDWDALYRLKYAANPYRMQQGPQPISGYMGEVFAISTDPLALLADRVANLLFLRGEIAPARRAFPAAIDEASLALPGHGTYDHAYQLLGLVARIGSQVVHDGALADCDATAVLRAPAWCGSEPRSSAPVVTCHGDPFPVLAAAGALPAEIAAEAARGLYRSDTGELVLDTRAQRFSLVTERSEGFSGPLGGVRAGRLVEVRGGSGYAMVFITAMDGAPLTTSRRLLVLFLTDVLATGSTFADRERTVYVEHGHAPLLLRAAETRIAIHGPPARVHAIDGAGRRIAGIPVERDGDAVVFPVSTGGQAPAMAYEVIRDDIR